MHPSCKQNINSTECQDWMNKVLSHCSRLLADKRFEFWDEWWLNEYPEAYYYLPHLMSALDCQKLGKNTTQQLSTASFDTGTTHMEDDRIEPTWQTALILIVACLALTIIMSMICLLNSTLRRMASPSGFKNYEYQSLRRKKHHGASPRSFISFGKPFSPLTRYGPYRSKSIAVPRDTCTAFK